jgi:hypothetical protein
MNIPEQRPAIAALMAENQWLKQTLMLLLRELERAPQRGPSPPPPIAVRR